MTDSPVFRVPVDSNEQPILEKLNLIRDELLLAKQDKTKYVKSHDVSAWYDQIIQQVEKLNSIRVSKRLEQNRLDIVLDSCLQLISLFFMTVGRNNEAPGAYSLVSTCKRLLDHLKEAAFFTDKDLTGIEHRLDKIEGSIERARAHHNPQIIVLLEAKIAACRANLVELRFIMEPIPKDLMATHEKLVSILRSLSGCNTRSNFPWAEINDYKRQLKEIESKLDVKAISEDVGGEDVSIDERMNRYAEKLSHISYTEASKLSGREIVRDLLERTILWGDLMTAREGKLDPRFQDKFNALSAIRNQLEKFSLTQAWSLRETDLYSYQRKLDRIDEERVNGNFIDESGRPADLYEQRTLLYLLRKSYSIIYFMLASSEPVSEALQPVYNQLSTLRKCLVEVKKSGGVSSPRELYPYSMKLHSLDNMRKDGKFIVNGDIPEGQASVIALLSECFEMAYELRNEAEKEEEEHEERPDEAENSAAIEMRQSAAGKGADAIPPDGGLARVVSVGGNH